MKYHSYHPIRCDPDTALVRPIAWAVKVNKREASFGTCLEDPLLKERLYMSLVLTFQHRPKLGQRLWNC